jgi:Ser/Thr protein kinase RdoA (MazF antagonist)
MSSFPVILSTLSPPHLAEFVNEKYGLAGAQCTLLKAGINHSYLVSAGMDKYVLRIYCHNWRTRAEIEEEIRFVNLLKENAVPVSSPVKDERGGYVQQIPAPEGTRYGVLFSFAPGNKVRYSSPEIYARLGALMARMHSLGDGQTLNRAEYTPEVLLDWPQRMASRFFTGENEEMRYMKSAGEQIKSILRDKESGLRKSIVHLDMWYDNFHIDTKSHITLFDFDFCGNGWPMLDIAYSLMQLFHIESDKAVYEQKKEAFLSGYVSVCPIPAAEHELIGYAGFAVWLFYLGVQCQRFDTWSNFFVSENYVKSFIGMGKNWLAYHDIHLA